MTRYYAPGHDDCFIDCSIPGAAHYIEELGPCVTECNEVSAANSIASIFRPGKEGTRVSGRVWDLSGQALAKIADGFAARFKDDTDEAADIVFLQALREERLDERYSASYSAVDLAGLLKALASAAGRTVLLGFASVD